MSRYNNQLQKTGLQLLNLQVSSGAIFEGVDFEFKNFIEVWNIFANTACYVWFPDVTTATLTNSIISFTTSIGASVPNVNGAGVRFQMGVNSSLNFTKPIICRRVQVLQASGSESVVTLFYKNYATL